jgi:hypothetical protein
MIGSLFVRTNEIKKHGKQRWKLGTRKPKKLNL